MKCVHPDCATEATLHPVITYAVDAPWAERGEVHLVMPLCAEHASATPEPITDGAFASLCEMVQQRSEHKPLRESVAVRFEPIHSAEGAVSWAGLRSE